MYRPAKRQLSLSSKFSYCQTRILPVLSATVWVVAAAALAQPVATQDEGMAVIPAGTYVPLYTTDKTPRPVASFRLDKLPVSKRQFLEFVRKNAQWQRSRVAKIFADKAYLSDWVGDLEPDGDLDAPVTHVSWFAARAYAKHHGKRLPTVDEWEYVARADETDVDATAKTGYTAVILEWYAKRSTKALPVAETFPANVYGVRAMHGLIWEWNNDFNNAMVTGESRGDSGIERNLFCAGGALSATDVSNYAAFMRYAFRSSLKGNYSTSNLGFRCAADCLDKKKPNSNARETQP